jgi:hypothetical protein
MIELQIFFFLGFDTEPSKSLLQSQQHKVLVTGVILLCFALSDEWDVHQNQFASRGPCLLKAGSS